LQKRTKKLLLVWRALVERSATAPQKFFASFFQKRRIFLAFACLALWLPGFFTLPPGDRDESRFAIASKQMNETGDYVRIMNGRVPRLRKPIGIYWLQAPAAALAGPGLANPIWPYRIPSLLGGILAVLATFEAGLALTQSRARATFAALMLASCVLLTAETHIAKTDAALLGVTTLAMGLLARCWLGAAMPRWQAALFWLAMGAGILIKGPITPMVAGLAAATLCVCERRAAWLRGLRPWSGAALMVAVVAPWFIAIQLATRGAFLAQSVGGDLGTKLAGGSESHGGFPGLHLLLLPLLAFPSTVFVLCGMPAAWTARREAATRFLIAWAAPAWLVFEAVPTKLPHYTLPLYPALFLLAARCPAPSGRVRAIGLGALAVAGAALACGAAAAPLLLGMAWWLGLPGMLSAGLVAWLAWRRPMWAIPACLLLYASLLQFELPALAPLWIAPRAEVLLRAEWPAWNLKGDGLAVAGFSEPSLVFSTGTDTDLLLNGAAAAAALKSGRINAALVAGTEMKSFLAAAPGARTLGAVGGFDYSRGRWVTLTLVTR
jgi:4-amino-4-deoxy-L-arabinose transferase-like glycosyltransferase